MPTETGADLRISTLLRKYELGDRTPAQVLVDVMARIAADRRKGVWITLVEKSGIDAQLRQLEISRRAGKPLPLGGIPFAVKDNIDVAGMPTTAACPAFAYTPSRSATVVRRLCDAGAIVVGKTNLDQFATGLVGTRSPYGVCENPFDPAWISGGSSSGSAVAVATDLVSFSLGTDTAGSGRVPASFNNLVGLKPTRGLVSTSGVVPACRSLDCVSIFTRNCEDAQRVLQVAVGEDEEDPQSRAAPPGMPPGPAGFRCGVPSSDQLEFFGNLEASVLFQAAVNRVRSLGATIVPIDFTPFRQAAELLYDGPWLVERLEAPGRLFRDHPEALRPELRAIFEEVARFSAPDVFNGFHKLAALRRQTLRTWAEIDVLLLPTTGTVYRIAEVEADPLRLNRNLGVYTNFVNLLDLSAIAVPNGSLSTGIPMGITFMAPAFQESRLFQIGSAFHNQGVPP